MPGLFCFGYFQDRVSRTIFLGWIRTVILLISASQVARITGVSHQHLTTSPIFFFLIGHGITTQARVTWNLTSSSLSLPCARSYRVLPDHIVLGRSFKNGYYLIV
jgi:hypothetical protein